MQHGYIDTELESGIKTLPHGRTEETDSNRNLTATSPTYEPVELQNNKIAVRQDIEVSWSPNEPR